MLKNLTLALLICNSANIYSMDVVYASTKKILSFFQPSPINMFENQLGGNQYRFSTNEDLNRQLCTFFSRANNNPELFLKYCYYLQEYQFPTKLHKIKSLKNNKTLLKKYQNTQINGFSAFGAAALAIYLPREKQKLLITALQELNFIPTDQDKTIIQLKFNTAVTTKLTVIAPLLLCNNQNTIFTTLPLEIKKIIINNVINIEKYQLSDAFYPF